MPPFVSKSRRSLAAWLVLVVMVLAFLAPGVSRAVAFVSGEVPPACPFHAGMTTQPAEDTETQKTAPSLDFCALCHLAVALPLPLAQSVAGESERMGSVQAPPRDLPLLLAFPGWDTQSRAPPAQA